MGNKESDIRRLRPISQACGSKEFPDGQLPGCAPATERDAQAESFSGVTEQRVKGG